MANPSMEQVVAMAGEYNLIPVAIRLLADMETPIRIFNDMRNGSGHFT